MLSDNVYKVLLLVSRICIYSVILLLFKGTSIMTQLKITTNKMNIRK